MPLACWCVVARDHHTVVLLLGEFIEFIGCGCGCVPCGCVPCGWVVAVATPDWNVAVCCTVCCRRNPSHMKVACCMNYKVC